MSRLTKYYNGIAVINGMEFTEAAKKLAHYEDLEEQGRLIELDFNSYKRDDLDRCTHRHCNDCDKYRRELQKYKDLEEQGKLIELPCAVGDTVYRIILDKVYEYTVGSFLVDENGAWGMSLLFEQEEKKFAANMDCDNLGKTVFLTKEEAEVKLKELEGDKE